MRTAKGKTKTQQQKTADYAAGGLYHWQRRFIKEMKQSAQVQAKVLSGVFDRYLDLKKQP